MRKLRLIALAAIAAVSMSAAAQYNYGHDHQYNPTSRTIYGGDNEDFGLLYVQYNPSKLRYSHDGATASTNYNAISLGYSYYFALGDVPFYISPGLAAQWLFTSDKQGSAEYKTNIISAKIPINLMYSIQVSSNFRIEPYAGIYGRINIWGQGKETYGGQSDTWDLFKDSEDSKAMKRFQLGWNAGLNFRITNAFTIGGGYYMDLMKVADHTRFQGFDITLGVNL